MARTSGQIIQNNFSKGLITEATGLNYPSNSCQDVLNCQFDQNGTISRRLGFEYENGWQSKTTGTVNGLKNEYVWKSAGINGTTTLIVLQEANIISFFIPDTQGRISRNKKSFTINLNTYAASGASNADVQSKRADFASGAGKLFIQHPHCEPIYVTYNESSSNITTTSYEILVRDMSGIEDGTTLGVRPSSLSTAHRYNLYNQGWDIRIQTGEGKNSLEDLGIQQALAFWDTYRSDFPSNSDVWWLYKDANDRFNYNQIDTVAVGNSPAPKGHYIDNAFFFDRSNISGVAGIAVKTSSSVRPSAVAFFAGRVWYAGVNKDDYVGKVYFTQIIESTLEIGKCYQRNDPTDENLSDLLDTDGGVVDLLEANNIIKMIPFQNSLMVFAENGIWVITGSQGTGFVATDYSVAKVSDVPVLSAFNFVLVDGLPIWWNNDGIYSLSIDGGQFNVKSLTEETIKTYYQSILAANLPYAKGAYSSSRKRIQWLFKSAEAASFNDQFIYDSVLVLDLTSGAFFPWSISDANPKVVGIIALDTLGTFIGTNNVIDSAGDNVIRTNLDNVIVNGLVTGADLIPQFSYYCVGRISGVQNRCTWAQTINTQYVDWQIEHGTTKDYESYFLTGPGIPAEGDKVAVSEYATFFSNNLINSSFFVQARWDFADASSSGKWSNPQQGYHQKADRAVQHRRLLLRGSGPALQLYISSESQKPFSIIGWSIWETANART